MGISAPNQAGRMDTEDFLAGPVRDFSAAYMAVKYLADHIHAHPETITARTVDVLAGVIESNRFQKQKQVLFLYGEAADALVTLAGRSMSPAAEPIISRLLAMLSKAQGKRLRAISQSIGRLPVSLVPFLTHSQWRPDLNKNLSESAMTIDFVSLADAMAGNQAVSFTWQGRSLAIESGREILGVIKFANSPENIRELTWEALWMERLNANLSQPGITLPRPFKIKGQTLFQISGLLPPGGPDHIHNSMGIAFIPCPGYYDYPNDSHGKIPHSQLQSIFHKNAEYLGRLSRAGIYHTALIPLFHNRVQQNRRNDNGAYLWEHGGRLDQWLDSCRFPNFAASGPRDFEHLETAKNSHRLRHYIGEHLLSFILVIGSYFRNKAPMRRGRDAKNIPYDTRDLFNQRLFATLVDGVCRAYFKGLVGRPCPPETKLAPDDLINSLVLAMGRDEHMEEVLRARDQELMNESEFKAFLQDRGVSLDMGETIEKGQEDIVLNTGPHLGGFNQPISVPSLIDHLFRFSAFCTAHCYSAQARPA